MQIVSGLLAGITGLSVAKQAQANIDLIDDRKVRDRGFDIIYEARDVDLPQAQRDGFTQVGQRTLHAPQHHYKHMGPRRHGPNVHLAAIYLHTMQSQRKP